MDLFHAVTQSIEKVLICHWYTEFKAFKIDDKKTMQGEPGGESIQYESIKTQTAPPAKQSSQLGIASSTTESPTSSDALKQKVGGEAAEKIRYRQNISESGMGGMTNSSGSTGQEGGYGGAPRDSSSGTQDNRAGQRYGSGNEVGG